MGPSPWFIPGIGGKAFLKKELEEDPFIKEIYLPNCTLVGPDHDLDFKGGKWVVESDGPYESEDEVTDEEFRELVENR